MSKPGVNSPAAKPSQIAEEKSSATCFTATVTSSKASTRSSPMPEFASKFRLTSFCSFLFLGFKENKEWVGARRKQPSAGSNLGGESMKQAFCKNAILALLALLVVALGASAQTLDRGAVHGFV